MSYHALLRVNDRVLDNLLLTSVVDADSLNKAYREAVYRSYLRYHQPDIYITHDDDAMLSPKSKLGKGRRNSPKRFHTMDAPLD